MNKPYSKEEYENIMAKIPRATIQDIEKLRLQFAEHVKTFPQKYIHGVQNEDSSGDYLNNTQRCTDCYDVFDSQDCRYVFNSRNCKMVHDMTVFGAAQGAQFCYEVHEIGDSVQKIKFSDQIWGGCAEITYSKLCMQSSKNLFGCVGLKKAQYCILNKQYTKDEWEALVPQIIEAMKNEGTWGEFFPHTMSPFAYNETVAQEYYPLEKEAAVAAGYGWRDPDAQEFRPATAELPKTIQEANDAILNEVFKCTECGKNYRLIAAELSFYKRAALPVPERCHNCRHRHRQSFRNPRTLYARACDKCSTAIQTTYAPSRLEPIYCEKCYLEAVD
ncbi:hypothetical protein COV82_00940 [Candidatus Peregrinibacteria bacterium CG11_big_fil_rev_8_21_14_0_20_46_8]|nr:MAG: hypothetical protein COV82_00940 [Candidatus Peregrinibacteria bacterium CG11_big_fil_rev_8_21_14_0_20_46_8]